MKETGIIQCVIMTLSIGAISCASPPPSPPFVPEVGMSSEKVLGHLGVPDAEYVGEFGRESRSGSWDGRVWLYFGAQDPRYTKIDRCMKNILIFYPPDGDMQLNHWDAEVEWSTLDGSEPSSGSGRFCVGRERSN
jgi:hypothetical protein